MTSLKQYITPFLIFCATGAVSIEENTCLAQGGSYKKCMKEGYTAYEDQRYEEAKDHFQKALSYKPENEEAKTQIVKCDGKLGHIEVEKQYQKIWDTAMAYYEQKDY